MSGEWLRKEMTAYGQQCAEAARAPLLEHIERLKNVMRGVQDGWNDDYRLLREAKARIAELDDLLRFVERWANHHAAKPSCSAKEALGVIQHHPSIVEITRSYADGKVPETFDPYARIAELEADAKRLVWVEKRAKQNTANDRYGNGGHWNIGFFSDDSRMNFRDAIDAAMNKGTNSDRESGDA